MIYYRLVFKNSNNGTAVSEVTEQMTGDDNFESMNWDKPIIKHHDGKYHHYLAIDRTYLDAMLAGIAAINEANSLPFSD